jgi:hypothetical protein
MAETSPTPHNERLTQANVRAAEQFRDIRSLVEYNERTRLHITYFTPRDCDYEAHYNDGAALISTSCDAANLAPIHHHTNNPFRFDSFTVIHTAIHEVELTLRHNKTGRVSKFTVSKIIEVNDGGQNVSEINYLDKLAVEAVEPQETLIGSSL